MWPFRNKKKVVVTSASPTLPMMDLPIIPIIIPHVARRKSYEVFKSELTAKSASGEGSAAAAELTERIKITAASGDFVCTHDFVVACGVGVFWDRVSCSL